MTAEPSRPDPFEPHAAPAMASMFDDVSPRYDLLNRLMTLGQDGAWRRAMWRAVPEQAGVVLDLCTGSGVSLTGLRRPGRLVLGMDVSFAMLERAAAEHGSAGWAPRLACADAFRLPLRDGALDAVTIAFGARNLRPRDRALAELARVLKLGGVLAVLEASAPRPGPLAPLHRFWIRRMIPLLGRLSPNPAAYRYLSESIFEFGPGPEFERALATAGFEVEGRQAFLLGAARLWAARRGRRRGEKAAESAASVQFAREEESGRGKIPQSAPRGDAEYRVWTAAQLAVAVTLLAALVVGLRFFLKSSGGFPLGPRARLGATLLLVAATVFSAVRAVALLRRLLVPPSRR